MTKRAQVEMFQATLDDLLESNHPTSYVVGVLEEFQRRLTAARKAAEKRGGGAPRPRR